MENADGVFSIRLVIADFYLEKPIFGLDPCYSEFRGKEIKKVPIIRIFGANAYGQKTCMHVHGVFPYFYIPYKKEDFESVNRAIFQIAVNIDKAINISLGQGSSNAQHVFKVQLVKGIPFYGYHRSDHQYFKIYMFNPRFVRRAANLLQNGSIMGKTFHPHESHVPYILQFMIDFNLYGMSFLHVPMEIVKFRRNEEEEEIPFKHLNPIQILDCTLVKKKSVSSLEVDIGSNFILNRFQLLNKNQSEHTNPGIEAIWNDEKVRRQKLIESLEGNEDKIKEIPILEVPATQERNDIYVSNYVSFYQKTLISKLESITSSESTFLSDETIASSQQNSSAQSFLFNSNEEHKPRKKRPFHLKALLVNAVYPDECTKDEQELTNASFIENHLSNNNLFQTTIEELKSSNESVKNPNDLNNDENIFLDDTILDEELILSLSQPTVPLDASLRKEDLDLLDVLKDLEDDNENENPIDLDSSLAPLSQTHKKLDLKPENFQKDCSAMVHGEYENSESETDTEDDTAKENLVDFSMALDDIDELLLKITQTQPTPDQSPKDCIPQMDGNADDDDNSHLEPKTPSKKRSKPYTLSPPKTPKRQIKQQEAASPKGSPKTPKAASKYAPLPLIFTNKSKNENSARNNSFDTNKIPSRSSTGSLLKNLALTKIRRKTIAVAKEITECPSDKEISNRPTTRRSTRSKINLDKTHITCNLTPKRKHVRMLKVYSTEADQHGPLNKDLDPPDNNPSSEQHQSKYVEKNWKEAKVEEKKKWIQKSNDWNKKMGKRLEQEKLKQTMNELSAKCSSKTHSNADKTKAERQETPLRNPQESVSKTFNNDDSLDSEIFDSLSDETTSKSIERAKVSAEKRKVYNKSKFMELTRIAQSNAVKQLYNEQKDEELMETKSRRATRKSSRLIKANIANEELLKAEKSLEENKQSKEEIEKSEKDSAFKAKTKRISFSDQSKLPLDEKVGDGNINLKEKKGILSAKSNPPFDQIEKSSEACSIKSISKKESEMPIQMENKRESSKDLKDLKNNHESLFPNKTSSMSQNMNSNTKAIQNELLPLSKPQESSCLEADLRNLKKVINPHCDEEMPSCSKTAIVNAFKNEKLLSKPESPVFCDNKRLGKSFFPKTSLSSCNQDPANDSKDETSSTSSSDYSLVCLSKVAYQRKVDQQKEDRIATNDSSFFGKSPVETPLTKPQIDTAAALNALNLYFQTTKVNNKEAMPSIDPPSNREMNLNLSGSNEDEEILASDDEMESSLKLSKTPNLKRLKRHSLQNQNNKSPLFAMDYLNTPKSKEGLDLQKRNLQEENSFKGSEKKDSLTSAEEKPKDSSEAKNETSDEEILEDDEPILMQSFYEQSFCLNSPSVFSRGSSPSLDPHNSEPKTPILNNSLRKRALSYRSSSNTPTLKPQLSKESKYSDSSPSSQRLVKITPLILPPTRDEVLKGCEEYGLFKYDFQKPFYSDPNDITKPKEVGFNILYIPGNKLNDLDPFQSVLGDKHQGLDAWRRKQLVKIGGPLMLNRFKKPQQIKEFFTSNKKVSIVTFKKPPTRHEAKLWLKARELMGNKQTDDLNPQENIKKIIEEDSPIKIKRQKITMVMNEGGENDNNNGSGNDEDSDCTLTLTPMTPTTPLINRKKSEKLLNESFTPVSSIARDSPTSLLNSRKKSNLSRRAKISLNAQLNAADPIEQPKNSEKSPSVIQSSQGSLKSSQSSDSAISSQLALAQMERSSFLKNLQIPNMAQSDVSFGLSNATLDNTFGFKVKLENLQHAKADIEYNYITIMEMELFVPTRGDLFPDPQFDEIRCIFYAIENSIPTDSLQKLPRKSCGYIIVNDFKDILPKDGRFHGLPLDIEVEVVPSELDALQALVELVHKWDPDIFAGYEIEMSSWGYVIDRAKSSGFNISPMLSRIPTQKFQETVQEERDQYTDLDFEMKLNGRILLDVWRLMRSEIALTSYTFENVMYHIRHSRCPAHSYKDLTTWYNSCCSRWIVLEYYIERVRGTLAILDQLDLIGRTSEMAKLIGIQFYEILSRGSQFRVESMMLRIAKPKNLVPLSPSVQQRAHMRAPEYIALIMEPESRFYTDPVIVLDFQSLYPSVIIAYNYCFSTCIGRIENLGGNTPFEFGASQLRVSPKMALKLAQNELLNYSSCGIAFVKQSVREGILPRMLTEILNTRQMVKQSMKLHKNNSALQRILHSRQLGLKLMANVTYGYTAANFSGRMPAVEIGDSVVARGRDTLEESMSFVEKNPKWNVRVVYGDTDSMFLLVQGRSREEAFKIGEEIAEAVTKRNPHPIKLKLEKVYQPCILQTKKRYVGYMYETADQKDPIFEAKGIETVRRDGCPAVGKMLEKVLRILFETKDVSLVKQYVNRQFTKLLQGKANLQDLVFAKEFRGLNGYRPTACVPALEMTRKWIQTDPRRIPRSGERVPFIVTNGPPGVPLIRLVRHPHEVLKDEGLKINAIYYITKAIIPPLNRCLLLIGADVNEWFAGLPRKLLTAPALSNANEVISSAAGQNQKKSTISQYFSSSNCLADCGRQTMESICPKCLSNKQKVYTILQSKISKYEKGYFTTLRLCQACCGRVGDLSCVSLDCPVMFVLEVKRREMHQCNHMRNILQEKFNYPEW